MVRNFNIMVSVVIPFYEYPTWLIEALRSVENQTIKESIEVIIINDGSKYDLEKIIMKENLSLPINIINKENGGPASARNMGIKQSKGKYIAFLDSDDIWLANKLEVQIKMMEKNNSVWSQHSYYYLFEDGTLKSINTNVYPENCYLDTFISFKVQTSCVIVRRDILFEDNQLKIEFPEDARYGQDLVFYRELAEKYELLSIPLFLQKFRIRGNNAGFRNSVQLSSRSKTWKTIQNKNDEKKFPELLRIAYILSVLGERAYNIFPKYLQNEFIAGVLYVPSYILIKCIALRRGKK